MPEDTFSHGVAHMMSYTQKKATITKVNLLEAPKKKKEEKQISIKQNSAEPVTDLQTMKNIVYLCRNYDTVRLVTDKLRQLSDFSTFCPRQLFLS